jgi:predicted type IV restriction endonuclease
MSASFCKEFRSMTQRSTSADFVTAFATGWPENQPDVMILSLTTQKGVQDFALTKEQALLVAKTMKRTATALAAPKQRA